MIIKILKSISNISIKSKNSEDKIENKNNNNIQIKKSISVKSIKSKNSEDTIKDKLSEVKENKKKHLKVLKKNTDNKEMQLSLDAECDICCYTIEELANPDGCNHDFCKNCLIEWSQRSEKCPICKTVFRNIFIYDNGIKKQIPLIEIRKKYKKEKKNDSNEDIEKVCYVCKKNTDPNNLIICGRCRGNYCHYYCIHLNKKPQWK